MNIRPATRSELPTVMTVLDSGLLAISAAEVRAAIAADRVLVAAESDRVLGTLVVAPDVVDSTRIDAIAVRRGRRGQGIGTALVRAAAEHYGPLVAEFEEGVRPFWASLGFDIQPAAEPGRFVGRLVGETEWS